MAEESASFDAQDAVRFDARGLTCPLPVLRAAKLLKGMASGALLVVTATDPASERDFKSFCAQTGNELAAFEEDHDGVFHYLIRKG